MPTMACNVDDCAFVVTNGGSSSNMNKWIIDLGAIEHMTPCRQAFDTYETISMCHVFLGDNGMVEAVGKRLNLCRNSSEGANEEDHNS